MPWGEKLMAARVQIKYRLEDISGEPCLIVRYNHVTPDLLRALDIRAVLVSGNGTDATEYTTADQAGLRAVFQEKAWPTLLVKKMRPASTPVKARRITRAIVEAIINSIRVTPRHARGTMEC